MMTNLPSGGSSLSLSNRGAPGSTDGLYLAVQSVIGLTLLQPPAFRAAVFLQARAYFLTESGKR